MDINEFCVLCDFYAEKLMRDALYNGVLPKKNENAVTAPGKESHRLFLFVSIPKTGARSYNSATVVL